MSGSMAAGEPAARILVVDDHPALREGLAARISMEEGLSVCGEAEDADEAVQLFAQLDPDLVILDITLKKSHGIDLIKRLKTIDPNVKVLVHSMHEEAVYAERSLTAGAHGYLNKHASSGEVVRAIRAVLAGKTYLSPEMVDRIVKVRVGGSDQPSGSPIDSLSDRELQVLMLIGEGLTSRGIADRLRLSIHTIDTYREKIKHKLNLGNSAELSRFAVQWVLEHR